MNDNNSPDLNALGRLVSRIFRSLDNVRLSTLSAVVIGLSALMFAVGIGATVVTLNNVTTITSTWHGFDTGLGRRIDLLAQMRGSLGLGGLIEHWDAWKAGDEAARKLVINDAIAIRALVPAWQDAAPGAEEKAALAKVVAVVNTYAQIADEGKLRKVDGEGEAKQALNTIADLLRKERADGADRVEASMWKLAATVGGIMALSAVLLIVLTLFFYWVTRFRVVLPIHATNSVMNTLASGNKQIAVPFLEKTDELGDMARTVEVFRDGLIKADRLEAEKRASDQTLIAQAQRRAELTDEFGVAADKLLATVAHSVGRVQDATRRVLELLDETTQEASGMAAAAQQSANNVSTVAAATEEMGASIAEIGESVTKSTAITRQAVDSISALDATMQELSESTARIDEIVTLIHQIADQTNLLALNAGIEAQRAGTAGKGFAVVANEVKNLARQTGKATEEIGQQIEDIRGKTDAVMNALRNVVGIVSEADTVVASIATAVEEQSATTSEIVRSITQAAAGNAHVSDAMIKLSERVKEVKSTSEDVEAVVNTMGEEAKEMQSVVRTFLNDVR
jgi:methyl-accepting chemotaxis protein